MRKKILAVVLSALLAAMLVPAAAFAEGETDAQLASEPSITSIEPNPVTVNEYGTKSVKATFSAALPADYSLGFGSAALADLGNVEYTTDRTSATFDVVGLEAGTENITAALYKDEGQTLIAGSSKEFTVNVNKIYDINVVVQPESGGRIGIYPEKAAEGVTVSVTVQLYEGMELAALIVTGDDGTVIPAEQVQSEMPPYLSFEFTMPACAVTITGKFVAQKPEGGYAILEGANGTYTIGSGTPYTIRANGDISRFANLVTLDGVVIDSANYDVTSGSTIVSLHSDYLDTLSAGTYKVGIVYYDEVVETTLTVVAAATSSTSPKTGDVAGNFAMLAMLAAAGAGVAAYTVRKRKND